MTKHERYFMVTYMYIDNKEYAYGRYLLTIVGALSIYKVEKLLSNYKNVKNVLVTGFFEMSEKDYIASKREE